MKSITVRSSLSAPPAFKNAGAAVSAAKEEDRNFQERIDRSVYGCIVKDISYTEATCDLCLDDRSVLSIGLNPTDLAYTCKVIPLPSSQFEEIDAPETISLRLGKQEFTWEPHTIIDSIVGTRLTNAFYNGINIYLYFSNGLLLSFSSLVTIPDHRPFLYWTLSD